MDFTTLDYIFKKSRQRVQIYLICAILSALDFHFMVIIQSHMPARKIKEKKCNLKSKSTYSFCLLSVLGSVPVGIPPLCGWELKCIISNELCTSVHLKSEITMEYLNYWYFSHELNNKILSKRH